MTTATTGTGTITLGSAVPGFLTFTGAGVADGTDVAYAISDGVASEIGNGTYTVAGTTLTRNVTNSTNGGGLISLSGSAEVFITPRATDLPLLSLANTFTASQTVTNLKPTIAPATGWGIDCSGVSVTVAGNSQSNLQDGAGLVLLTDSSSSGQTGAYLTGASAVTFLGSTGSAFVAPTTTPAANKYCVAFDGVNTYRIYNGNASSITFIVAMIRCRNTI